MTTATRPAGAGGSRSLALQLLWLTVAWNVIERVIAVTSGLFARSVALVGFGLEILNENEGELRFEADAEFLGFDTYSIDDGTGETKLGGATGVYKADVDFDETGAWGVEITGNKGGRTIGPITLAIEILAPEQVLGVGDPAPRTRQQIASDVADIRDIESMQPSDPFHDTTIAYAVTSGKPSVIIFGTPAFCETMTCGPVMQTVMLPLYEEYKDKATFIHVEPYRLEELRSGRAICAVPAFNAEFARQGLGEGGECPKASEQELQAAGESWNLTTEPILFVVDAEGDFGGRFEGVSHARKSPICWRQSRL